MELYLSIAFITGLVSSFHCIGMCGPIALALPVGRLSIAKAMMAKVTYNFGRILSYSTMGLIIGYFGKQFYLIGLQQNLSILIGLFLLGSLFFKKLLAFNIFSKASFILSGAIRKYIQHQSIASFLALGILNGLLPCGMVYLALAAASATGSPFEGALFMALFGLGTAPMMLAIGILPKLLSFGTRQKINQYLPIYTLFLAVFFVIRGLGLGIPYMSPQFEKSNTEQAITVCHTNKILK